MIEDENSVLQLFYVFSVMK